MAHARTRTTCRSPCTPVSLTRRLPRAPEPGTGTVWVIPPEEDLVSAQLNVPGYWEGVWRAGVKHTGVASLTKDEAVAWALCQPATQWQARDHMGSKWTATSAGAT